MKHYKIRSKTTGLFSKGGMPPTYNKTGKTWPNIGGVKNHLHLVAEYRGAISFAKYVNDSELIEFTFELTKSTTSELSSINDADLRDE